MLKHKYYLTPPPLPLFWLCQKRVCLPFLNGCVCVCVCVNVRVGYSEKTISATCYISYIACLFQLH